jgi:hypothetical protein
LFVQKAQNIGITLHDRSSFSPGTVVDSWRLTVTLGWNATACREQI